MNSHSYQKNSLSLRLKQEIFPLPRKILQDYPLRLSYVCFFLSEELRDEDSFLLYDEMEMKKLWNQWQQLKNGHGLQTLLSPFAKSFYNGRIETLFKEHFPELDLEMATAQAQCLAWFQTQDEIFLEVSRDLASCLLFEWILQLSHSGI